jgi:hypothetical protein
VKGEDEMERLSDKGYIKSTAERQKETHGRSRVPHIGWWRLESIKDWLCVLPYDDATVPRVVLARKEHFINRRLCHSLFFFCFAGDKRQGAFREEERRM